MHEVHVKQVGLNEGGFIAFVADFPHERCLTPRGGTPDAENPCVWCDHKVSLHPEALASRMRGYGLETPEEAFDAIVREHALRLHHALGAELPQLAQKDGLVPEDDSRVGELGGLHSQVKVVHGKHRLGDVLKFHADLIEDAVAKRDGQQLYAEASRGAAGLRPAHKALLLTA